MSSGSINKSKKVAILTNMVAPYRVPFFRELAKQVKQLDVLTCVDREVDRQWQVENDQSYNTKKLSGITLNLTKGRDAKRILHFRFGIIGYLLFSRPDTLVIGDASWTSFIAAFFCKLLYINYVVWNEITTSSKVSGGLVSKLRRLMYKGAKRIIASCSMARDYLLANTVPAKKISIVNNAVDNNFYLEQKSKWLPKREPLRQELNIDKDAFCFIYVGQLISRKRVIETVKLLADVNRTKKVHLIVAGTGLLEEKMRKTASANDFNNISFCGYAKPDRLCQLYTASDALVLFSEDEPWGMVVNECLLMGKPYIVSDRVAAGVELQKLEDLSFVVSLELLNKSVITRFMDLAAVTGKPTISPQTMAGNFYKAIVSDY